MTDYCLLDYILSWDECQLLVAGRKPAVVEVVSSGEEVGKCTPSFAVLSGIKGKDHINE